MKIRRSKSTQFENAIDVSGPGADPAKRHASIGAALSYAQGLAVAATVPVVYKVREFEDVLYRVTRDEHRIVLTERT